MESLSSKKTEEQRRQEEIKKQIAHLQAQLKDPTAIPTDITPSSPKRKTPDSSLLVPATPSPKKKRRVSDEGENKLGSPSRRGNQKPVPLSFPIKPTKDTISSRKQPKPLPITKQPPSNVLQKLSSLSGKSTDDTSEGTLSKSSGFRDAPATRVPQGQEQSSETALRRDDRLALVEELEVGPAEHRPPFDDPHFEKLEPNSGIRLSQRAIPYNEFQDYLRGRYYLSPSRLYSVIRLLPSKAGYEVPVEGDWVTIAVVAERGPVKFSRAPVGTTKDDDGIESDNEAGPSKPPESKQAKPKGKGKDVPQERKPHGKRYVNLKLIDFGARSGGASATGGKAVIRGDAFLTLLLFESDGCEVIENDEAEKRKVWRGGSKGAFEAMAKLKEGAVVALLNPRILKPFQRSNDAPHPVNNILALTPESADSIVVIGHAKDLGMCTVVKRDGKICGGWCDKRVSDVCEWHIQTAVERRRAGRSEFSIGTSGMSSNPGGKRRRPEYDPQRQWGLKPELNTGAGAVYVVSGHVVSGSSGKNDMFVSETIGRESQAKAARKLAAKDADKALRGILKRDKEGMKAVIKAREFGLKEKEKTKGGVSKKGDAKGKEKADAPEASEGTSTVKNAFSAKMIKELGFDPTNKNGSRKADEDSEVQKKLQTLTSLTSLRSCKKDADFEASLSSRPGRRRSQLTVPLQGTSDVGTEEKMVDLDD